MAFRFFLKSRSLAPFPPADRCRSLLVVLFMIKKQSSILAWGLFLTPIAALVTFGIAQKFSEARETLDKEKWLEKKYNLHTVLMNQLITNRTVIGSHIDQFPGLEEGADHFFDQKKQTENSIGRLIVPEALESIGRNGKPTIYRKNYGAFIPHESGDRVLIYVLSESMRKSGTSEGFYPTSYVIYLKNDHILAIGQNGYTMVH
jgi:hypothetical protein